VILVLELEVIHLWKRVIEITKKNQEVINNTEIDVDIIWLQKANERYENFGNAVDIDSHNNVIAVRNSFDGKTYNSKIVKYDEKGSLIWHKTYDSKKHDMAYDVSVDSNDNIIVVGFEGEWIHDPIPNAHAYVLKYDKNGALLWSKSFKKGICTMGFGVTNDSEGNIYFISTFFSPGEPNLGCWVIKCDKKGNQIWDRTFHEHYMDIPHGITVDSDGNIIIVGYAYTPYKRPYKPRGPWTAGFLSLKYNKNGNLLWEKRYEALEPADAFDVAVDSHDNIIIVGQNSGNPIIIKTNQNGRILWKKRYKTKTNNMPYGVDVNSKDDIIIGNTSYSSKKPKNLIITYDKNGEIKSIKKSKINRTIFDITIDHQDSIISVGATIGTKDDFYLLKEKPE